MVNVASGQLGMSTSLGDILGSSTEEMNAEFNDYAALGVKWLRVDFWWHHVQTSQNGGYNWSLVDKVVNAAEPHGIEVVGILNGIGGKQSWVDASFASASTREAFAEFAGAAAAHFGDDVNYWEIWNEPNMKGITPANYTSLLKGVHTAINAVDSGDVVISGGTAATPQTGNGLYGAVDFLQQMYANGAKGYFDAVGYHPYTFPLMPEDPKAWNGWQIMEDGIRQTMVNNGDGGLQIWMTELGAPTAGGGHQVTQAEQAEILRQGVDLAEDASWAGPIMWYEYEDDGGSTSSTLNWFGLVGPNGERKQAYDTYKALANGQDGSSPSPTSGASSSGTTYTGTDAAENIVGDSQNNLIRGNGGNDTISGGAGNDIMHGGSGNDVFIFHNTQEVGWDMIRDFQAGDKIDLSGIDANTSVSGNQSFDLVGSDWLSNAGDLGIYQDSNGHTSIPGDINGDRRYDFTIWVDGHNTFTASDFVL
jgi:hypothetical protein